MKRMIISWICLLAMAASLAGCSQEAAEEATTTLTGIVTAVEGTVITVQEMGSGRTNRVEPEGERPSMPQGGFSGTLPEGATLPESGFGGTLPEGATMPEGGFGGKRPDGNPLPGDSFDGTRPEGDQRGLRGEGTQIDLANAHITVEFDGGKATGTMEDIAPGAFVTVTLDSSGTATNLVVAESSGFGGQGGFGGHGGFGGNGGSGGSGFDRLPGSTEPTV